MTTILTTKQSFFKPISLELAAIGGNFVIDFQDHFCIGVAHPLDAGIDFHAIIPAHGAEGMAEIVRGEGDVTERRKGAAGGKDGLVLFCSAIPSFFAAVEGRFKVKDIGAPHILPCGDGDGITIGRCDKHAGLAFQRQAQRSEQGNTARGTIRFAFGGNNILIAVCFRKMSKIAKGDPAGIKIDRARNVERLCFLRTETGIQHGHDGGMGTMGFGIPAAIGAAFARPDHKTVAVCGDGGAQMTFEEIVVAVEHKLPVTFVVINNGCLGMVRQWQELFYKKNYAGSILTVRDRPKNENLEGDLKYDYLPDIVKLAEAHGAKAYRVIDPAKLDSVIAKAVKSDATTLVEVIVEPRANVYPMIPAGKPVSDMVFD